MCADTAPAVKKLSEFWNEFSCFYILSLYFAFFFLLDLSSLIAVFPACCLRSNQIISEPHMVH